MKNLIDLELELKQQLDSMELRPEMYGLYLESVEFQYLLILDILLEQHFFRKKYQQFVDQKIFPGFNGFIHQKVNTHQELMVLLKELRQLCFESEDCQQYDLWTMPPEKRKSPLEGLAKLNPNISVDPEMRAKAEKDLEEKIKPYKQQRRKFRFY